MPNQVQLLRSTTAAARPAGRLVGEPWVNFADLQFGVFNAAPTPLIAVRYWAATASYAIGDAVIQGGQIWTANAAIPPGPFVPAQWVQITGTVGNFLPIAGGTMTGPITLAGNAAAPLQAMPLQQMTTTLLGYLPLTAGAPAPLTGQLHLPIAAPTLDQEATNKLYVDTADADLQTQIDAMAGNLIFVGTINATTSFVDYTAASGLVDANLPAASAVNLSTYVIVSAAGPGTGNLPLAAWVPGDWAVSNGTAWIRIPTGQAAVTAPQVTMAPVIGPLGPNVQTSIAYLDTNKVELSGDTMTGPLVLSGPPTVALNPVSLLYLQDYVIDVGTFP
jgi:hypothetical protein